MSKMARLALLYVLPAHALFLPSAPRVTPVRLSSADPGVSRHVWRTTSARLSMALRGVQKRGTEV